jgi:hypothetical protein
MSLLAKLIGRSSQPLPQLDHAHPLVRELKAALRALDALPLTKKEEVESWYAASEVFQKRLRADWSSIYDSIPHELEHYLVDADIRAKDPGYARYQRDLLASLLAPEEAIQPPQTTTGSSAPDRV